MECPGADSFNELPDVVRKYHNFTDGRNDGHRHIAVWSGQRRRSHFHSDFYKITLPLLKPILLYVMITSLIGGLQMYDVLQVLTNGTGEPMRSSMTLIMFLNKHLYSKNYGMGGALSVILFFITGILSLLVFRFSNYKKKEAALWIRKTKK